MVQVFVNVDRRPKTMTYAAAYTLPVIFYKGPPQSTATTIYIDPALIRDVIEGLQKELRKPVIYSGFRNMHP